MYKNALLCGSIKNPCVLFLHGFLGEKEDWQQIIEPLANRFYCLAIDYIDPSCIIRQLDELNIKKCSLVGYSMGGRIALQLKVAFPGRFLKTIALSAHVGLNSEEEKNKRWEEDLKWIEILKKEGIHQFLTLFYKQPVFETLQNTPLLAELILKRSKLNPLDIEHMLKRNSLAHQNFNIPKNTHFLCGAKDLKYLTLYRNLLSAHQFEIIEGAGHAIHLENPEKCGELLCKHLIG